MSEDNKTLKQELEAILWNGDGRDPGTLSAIIKAVRDWLPGDWHKRYRNLAFEYDRGFNDAIAEVREILGGNDE